MNIRHETALDHGIIRSLIGDAFGQTDEAELVDALRQAGALSCSLVAEVNDRVVGHVALSRLRAPERCLALAPVSVHPDLQGRGIGSALIAAAIAAARSDGCCAIFVVGAPDYYTRFGFSAEQAAGFNSPFVGPYFMMLNLTSQTLTPCEVVYDAAFDGL